jgi:two-component system cell cycle response regulator DivK
MRRIALVEDNPDNRLLVQAILEDAYEVLEFASGQEAIAGLVGAAPDLVLLDISLPGMDGTDVLTWLRGQPSLATCPVVALTAHAMAGDREKYLAAGFDDYVTKPIVDEEILFSALRRWLSPTD